MSWIMTANEVVIKSNHFITVLEVESSRDWCFNFAGLNRKVITFKITKESSSFFSLFLQFPSVRVVTKQQSFKRLHHIIFCVSQTNTYSFIFEGDRSPLHITHTSPIPASPRRHTGVSLTCSSTFTTRH